MQRDVFDSVSPVDYRYWDERVAYYLSENGFTRSKLAIEEALVCVLYERGVCSEEVYEEVKTACREHVTTDDVYKEEGRIKHDIRAMVNCIREHVSDGAKPYVHLMATSYDIVDSANAMRYRDVVFEVVIPALEDLEKTLIALALREADTVQIGRTHGQHAVPITFGFAMAGYVSRLGDCMLNLLRLADELCGKFSGAVGAYNASALFFDDAEKFEREVLGGVGWYPAEHSTQIVPPEPLIRLLSEVVLASGIMANLARDMRSLQRTEIGEVGEEFEADQVGSSTMSQKQNPINFENAESQWKIVLPQMMAILMTELLDQVSEHQRDLTNSASARTYGEMILYAVSTAKRLSRTMQKLVVNRDAFSRN